MPNRYRPENKQTQPPVYQIRLKGHLDEQWSEWFSGMEVTMEANGETLLTGALVDQAALYGLLRKIRDLGMPLISVSRVESGQVDTGDGGS